jgi:hypothetical protein
VVQKAERVDASRSKVGTKVEPKSGAKSGAPRRAQVRVPPTRPVGNVTRGTTNPNRMRRLDRWLAGPQAWRLRAAADPLVVDIG